jgi:hypothetical protein
MKELRQQIYGAALEAYSRAWAVVDLWDQRAWQLVAFAAVVYGLLAFRTSETPVGLRAASAICILLAAVVALLSWWLLAGAETIGEPGAWRDWLNTAIAQGSDTAHIEQAAFDALVGNLSTSYDKLQRASKIKGRLVRTSAVLLLTGILLDVIRRFLPG